MTYTEEPSSFDASSLTITIDFDSAGFANYLNGYLAAYVEFAPDDAELDFDKEWFVHDLLNYMGYD